MSVSKNFDFGSDLHVILTKDSVIINSTEEIVEGDIRYKLSSFPSIALNWVHSSRQLILFNPTGGNINFVSLFLEICKSFSGKDIEGFILHSVRELKKIREFLKGGKESRRSDVLGLYAEMLVFKLLLSKIKDEKKIISSWGRPIRHPQDFVFDQKAYEVKFKGRGKDTVRIDSERQLDFEGTLYLVIVSSDTKFDSESEECHFARLHDEILEALSEAGKEAFRNKIKIGGVQYDSGVHSLGLKVSTMKTGVHLVEDGFPRITSLDLPEGVSEVAYSLYTGSIKKYIDDEYFK
ncbi:PD-(D/E)XK motif protein [Schleiferiaceae bacterium]|nr:PD-(D/E)XK motif protein [Schleiferiaceae bacterium]